MIMKSATASGIFVYRIVVDESRVRPEQRDMMQMYETQIHEDAHRALIRKGYPLQSTPLEPDLRTETELDYWAFEAVEYLGERLGIPVKLQRVS